MAESANFAANRWVEYGKRFRDCVCLDQDRDISINMAPFVKAVQPEKYKTYMEGRDFALHPEDPWYIRLGPRNFHQAMSLNTGGAWRTPP